MWTLVLCVNICISSYELKKMAMLYVVNCKLYHGYSSFYTLCSYFCDEVVYCFDLCLVFLFLQMRTLICVSWSPWQHLVQVCFEGLQSCRWSMLLGTRMFSRSFFFLIPIYQQFFFKTQIVLMKLKRCVSRPKFVWFNP